MRAEEICRHSTGSHVNNLDKLSKGVKFNDTKENTFYLCGSEVWFKFILQVVIVSEIQSEIYGTPKKFHEHQTATPPETPLSQVFSISK